MLRALLPASLALACGLLAVVTPGAGAAEPTGVLDYKVKDIDGKDVELAKYKGDVLLVVNVASECGLTPQYKALEEVYEKNKDKGFKVLGFPANEFGHQEPGSDADIKSFCEAKYKVTFPMFSKIVVKGDGIHPLYQFLTDSSTDPKFSGAIPWNFTKFLVDRQGKVIARFDPKVTPDSPEVTKAIEAALAAPKS